MGAAVGSMDMRSGGVFDRRSGNFHESIAHGANEVFGHPRPGFMVLVVGANETEEAMSVGSRRLIDRIGLFGAGRRVGPDGGG